MAKYTVDFNVNGYFTVEVEAESIEKAKEEATNAICDADFGVLEDIDSYPLHVLDEKGSYVWQEG